MANAVKGEVSLKLPDGRSFVLVADFEALVEAESAANVPLPELMAKAGLGFIAAQRLLLLGVLRRHQPEITVEECSALLLQHLDLTSAALIKALELGFPDAKEGKKGANPPRAPAGKSSGASGAKRASTRKASGMPPRARSS